MTMSSTKLPSGLLELIVHRNGTSELVEPEPICEDYSDCEDTVDLPLEPEQESTSVPPTALSKEIFLKLKLGFKPLAPELSQVTTTSYGAQPPHRVHYHWKANLEDWNNYWSTQWANHWRSHWRHHRNKLEHLKRKWENPRNSFNNFWNTRHLQNTGHLLAQERGTSY